MVFLIPLKCFIFPFLCLLIAAIEVAIVRSIVSNADGDGLINIFFLQAIKLNLKETQPLKHEEEKKLTISINKYIMLDAFFDHLFIYLLAF